MSKKKATDDGEVREATAYLGNCLRQIDKQRTLTMLFLRAVAGKAREGPLMNAFYNLREKEGKPLNEEEKAARRADIELADAERKSGYPTIIGHAVVSLHGDLEQTVRGYLARSIAERHWSVRRESIKKLKIRVSDYLDLTPLENAYAVMDAFETEHNTRSLVGGDRFDRLLSMVGIEPDVPKIRRNDLAELSSVRNLLAHGQREADQRFCSRCPWLRATPGDPLELNMGSYTRYGTAVSYYLTATMNALTKQVVEHSAADAKSTAPEEGDAGSTRPPTGGG